MQLQTEQKNGLLIVSTPRMDLDASNADDFKKSTADLIEGQPSVIIDLSNIGFMDSAGLGAILSMFKKVRAEGGQFRAFGLSDEVKALFDLIRIRRLFEIHPDKESAIQAAQS